MLIKLLQWNTLADIFSNVEAFPKTKAEILEWEYRKPLITKLLKQYDADIYTFQEIDHPELFEELYSNTHVIIHHKKPQNQDGILLVIRKTLKILDIQKIPYECSANQFFMFVKFEQFNLYVTHLKAKKEFESVRKEQLIQLNTYLSKDKNCIVCGDFNTEPQLEAIQHFIKISNLVPVNVNQPTTSKNRGKLETNIKDYIFYRNVNLKKFELPQVVFPEEGLPSQEFPSDHLYLYSEFEI